VAYLCELNLVILSYHAELQVATGLHKHKKHSLSMACSFTTVYFTGLKKEIVCIVRSSHNVLAITPEFTGSCSSLKFKLPFLW